MTRLFLFSHQDDEIGVLHTLSATVSKGEKAVCVYLTDGAFAGVSSASRRAECRAVLNHIGVPTNDIYFLGEELGIADGRLVENLQAAYDRMVALAAALPDLTAVIMHAWEGGHHDHDATHLLGQALASRLELDATSRQFPLYRASPDGNRLTYGYLDPAAGGIESLPIGLAAGLRCLLLLRHYRSQARVIVQLCPHITRAWLIERHERLQVLPLISPLQRPSEHLLYERWKFYTFEQFRTHAQPFVEKHLTRLEAPTIHRAAGGR